ncbi:hypothetical protein FOA52_005165 [Chlamydomonas sp. UWO 241]|nr:hypothetical protein FOA52_005165 [Chlamydomonas sp. UWO 241]
MEGDMSSILERRASCPMPPVLSSKTSSSRLINLAQHNSYCERTASLLHDDHDYDAPARSDAITSQPNSPGRSISNRRLSLSAETSPRALRPSPFSNKQSQIRVNTATEQHVLVGHADKVSTLAFSPDASVLASGSKDRTVRLWDPQTGQLRVLFAGHKARVQALAFASSGSTLFSAGKDKSIIEWDLLRNVQRKTITGHTGDVWAVALSKEGTRVVSVSQNATVSPDGNYLATGSADSTISIWSMESGKCIRTLHSHTGHVRVKGLRV